MIKRLRHLAEYAGAAAGIALVRALPAAQREGLARRLGDAFFSLSPARRRTACDNIRRAGVAEDPARVDALARASFRHMAAVAVEALGAAQALGERTWREHVELDIPRAARDMLADPKQGVILVSGHIGNWEVGALALSHLKPVLGIARPMDNPLVERLIRRGAGGQRFTTVPKRDANPFQLVSALRRGGMLAILTDQHARTDGLMVDFFGHPASTHQGCALLHRLTGAPLWFACCLRTGPMRFRLRGSEPVTFPKTEDREADMRRTLEWVNGRLEHAIREHPEQYLWAHRRWRSPPAAAAVSAAQPTGGAGQQERDA